MKIEVTCTNTKCSDQKEGVCTARTVELSFKKNSWFCESFETLRVSMLTMDQVIEETAQNRKNKEW